MVSFKQLQELISQKLTWKVFENILKKQNNCENVKLIDIALGQAIKRGDSYLSNVSRFSVEYSGITNDTNKNKVFKLYVIAKTLQKNVAQRKTFRICDFFKNEVSFYEKIWPQLDAFQKEMKVKDLFQEIPNYLCGHCDGITDYILLEDLSFQGYQGVDRSVALSMENMKIILRIIARFHALGIALKLSKPELFDSMAQELNETIYHENFRTWYANLQKVLIGITLDAVQKQLPEEYSIQLLKVVNHDIFGETSKLCAAITNLTTITQGDAWIPNFLMRYDESMHALHSVMIDFQLTRCSSLAQDVNLFIYSGTDADLLSSHYEEMLKYYCQEFNVFYTQLSPNNAKGSITYDELMDELKANGVYCLSTCMDSIIMSMLEDDEVTDFEQIEGEDAVPLETVWILKPIKTHEKRLRLAKCVKHMIDNHFI